jgi:hypothetical protein
VVDNIERGGANCHRSPKDSATMRMNGSLAGSVFDGTQFVGRWLTYSALGIKSRLLPLRDCCCRYPFFTTALFYARVLVKQPLTLNAQTCPPPQQDCRTAVLHLAWPSTTRRSPKNNQNPQPTHCPALEGLTPFLSLTPDVCPCWLSTLPMSCNPQLPIINWMLGTRRATTLPINV